MEEMEIEERTAITFRCLTKLRTRGEKVPKRRVGSMEAEEQLPSLPSTSCDTKPRHLVHLEEAEEEEGEEEGDLGREESSKWKGEGEEKMETEAKVKKPSRRQYRSSTIGRDEED
jgi:hypothetical protein